MSFHFGWKTQTKQINYSSLSFSASLDTQNNFQGGIIVEWKKFRQEIPVCLIPCSNLRLIEEKFLGSAHILEEFCVHFSSVFDGWKVKMYLPFLARKNNWTPYSRRIWKRKEIWFINPFGCSYLQEFLCSSYLIKSWTVTFFSH